MIKQLLNSVIEKYRDLSVSRRSIIGLLSTGKSRYFAQPRPIIVNYFISTGITGKIAELLMQVMYRIHPIIKARINKSRNATSFGKFFRILYSFCTSIHDSKFISFLEPLVAEHTDIELSFGEFFQNFSDSIFFSR